MKRPLVIHESRSGRTFTAFAVSVVPEAAQLDAAGWREFDAIVSRALSKRPASIRRQVALFVHLLNLLSIMRYGSSLHALIPSMRTEFLQQVQNSRFLILRRGFWGLRTLVFMGFYARPAAAALVGYRALARGWHAREQGAIG